MSVDYDLLADYVGGALEGTPDEARVAALIRSSPQWRRAAEELSGAFQAVSEDLAALRAAPVEPMPGDVATRIRESLRELGAAGAHDPFEGTRDPFEGTRDPLASRVVVKGGHRRTRPRRWKRWAAPIAVAAAALAFFALGGGPELVAPTMSDNAGEPGVMKAEAPSAAIASLSVPVVVTGRQYTRETVKSLPIPSPLPSDARSLMQPDTAGKEKDADAWRRTSGPDALQKCLNAVAAVLPGTVTFVEYAYFEGKPALVISITSVNQRWRFVAGPACGESGADELFKTPL